MLIRPPTSVPDLEIKGFGHPLLAGLKESAEGLLAEHQKQCAAK